ncbi:NAD(P)-binding domain-containing protein [Aquimarina gracilis]|uniref:NAD(P)-binding domain-containing protein n=1 Tax=Aquimarina gracilis TaxID=874422 RepID=A0ABU5ZSR6_9FLAO|nr:NAD(P)-binding domain-containing protein [Aquimarina gracilis]MEB3345105.1 NAD(P)-binding domain-containing protein [Aquimarina gracilis]
MQIGIIGSGNIGGTIGSHFIKAGHKVMFSSRHPNKLEAMALQLGINAQVGTIAETANFGEILLLAIPHGKVPEVSKQIAHFKNKIVIDATNYYPQRDGNMPNKEANENNFSQSQWTASYLPQAHIVKAFNTIYFMSLRQKAFSKVFKMTIPIAYDNDTAGSVIKSLLNDIGFDNVVIGNLNDSAIIEPDAPLYGLEATKEEFMMHLED